MTTMWSILSSETASGTDWCAAETAAPGGAPCGLAARDAAIAVPVSASTAMATTPRSFQLLIKGDLLVSAVRSVRVFHVHRGWRVRQIVTVRRPPGNGLPPIRLTTALAR